MRIRSLFCILLMSVLLPAFLSAEEVVFYKAAALDFKPLKADYLLLLRDGRTLRYKAEVFQFDSEEEKKWHFLSVVDYDKSLRPKKLVLSVSGEFSGSRVWWEKEEDLKGGFLSADPAMLRIVLSEIRNNLKSLELKKAEQEKSLSRMESNTEVEGYKGRFVQISKELRSSKKEKELLKKHIKALSLYLEQGEDIKEPVNYLKRTTVLNEQLTELARVAQAVEGDEKERMYRNQMTGRRLQQAARELSVWNVDDLQAELNRLKKMRLRLEQETFQAGTSSEALYEGMKKNRVTDEYELPSE